MPHLSSPRRAAVRSSFPRSRIRKLRIRGAEFRSSRIKNALVDLDLARRRRRRRRISSAKIYTCKNRGSLTQITLGELDGDFHSSLGESVCVCEGILPEILRQFQTYETHLDNGAIVHCVHDALGV